jgi:hypothetical protein
VRWGCMAVEKRVVPLTVLTRMGPRNERGSWTCMEPLDERVESLTARRTSPFVDFVSCYEGIIIVYEHLKELKDKRKT